MQKKAVIDIDNTLWQFCDALYEELVRVNPSFPVPEQWTHWDLWEGYCSEKDFFSAVNRIHLQQNSGRHTPYPEAGDFLKALRAEGYCIFIASHRDPDTRGQTEQWLSRHGLVYDTLHLSYDKTALFDDSISVVVDDSPGILEKAAGRGLKCTGLLFPWNEAHGNNGFRLFGNLNDVLGYILNQGREEISPQTAPAL